MIAACPKCHTRYRVPNEKVGSDGARLRCTQCGTRFRVRLPHAASASVSPPAVRAETHVGGGGEILVATPDADCSKRVSEALRTWGFEVVERHDGVEAMLEIQRRLPRAVILDPTLPKMFGFQICELMKRNAELRAIRVVLMGAVHEPNRYHRPPSDLYGADAYVEMPDLPEALEGILRDLGVTKGGGLRPAGAMPQAPPPPGDPFAQPTIGPQSEPGPRSEIGPDPGSTQTAPPVSSAPVASSPAASGGSQSEVASPVVPTPAPAERSPIEEAERLARVIVSDVVLYHDDKFRAAIAAGEVLAAMEPDLADGRAHFRQRLGSDLPEDRDFIGEELLRVARARGMEG